MAETTLTPSRLWKRMTGDKRLQAARAFWHDEQAADDQLQAVLLPLVYIRIIIEFGVTADTIALLAAAGSFASGAVQRSPASVLRR